MNKKQILILLLIISLALIFRVFNVAKTPPSPDWDEAALGYNAYSILKTGRDEYGKFLPLVLRSFNDYKPAFYAYAAIPSIAVFGLNVFSVRLPSVIFGTLTVLGLFFLCRQLMLMLGKNRSDKFPFYAAFLLAISPWHLQFSRAAFEANSALFLIIWGIYFLLCSLNGKKWFMLFSAVFLGLSLHAYHSARVFVPLFIILVAWIFKDKIKKYKKTLLISILVALIFIIPAVSLFFSKQGVARLAAVSVFGRQNQFIKIDAQSIQQDKDSGLPFSNIIHNRRITYAKSLWLGYLTHFDPKWLFVTGDNIERHHAPDMGLLYLTDILLLTLGIYYLVNNKSRGKWLIITWGLISVLPGTPTEFNGNALRSMMLLPVLVIVSALGFEVLAKKKIMMTVFIMFAIFNFIYYLEMYHRHMDIEYSEHWQYGYEQAITETNKLSSRYNKIIFSEKLEQPYIFFLFFNKYDPKLFQAQGSSRRIGKYEFKTLDFQKEEKSSPILYIGKPEEFPDGVKVLKTIDYLNGKPAVLLVEG